MTRFEGIKKENEHFEILLEELDGLIEYGKMLSTGQKRWKSQKRRGE